MPERVSRRGYLNVSVPPALGDWLGEMAAETGLPRAQLVRFVLEMIQRDPELLRRALSERLPRSDSL